jgi:hypothetical protein
LYGRDGEDAKERKLPAVFAVIFLVARVIDLKVTIKLSLCLTKHHTMKTYLRVEVYLHAFIISALDGSDCSASRLSHFSPGARVPDTRWIGGWEDPRLGLDVVAKKISSLPLPGI